jgi:ATP-dependent RNA helicase HelY
VSDRTLTSPDPQESTGEPVIPHESMDDIRNAINQFSALYPFPLDTFQQEAIGTLLRGDSVMVAAPTGSGKTVVAEFGIYDAFRRASRVIYTAPIKALSNQKFRDLRAIYGNDVGLLTGDVTENRDARIIVMTTEILRNMLLQSPWELDDVETVIFDEIHYLADPERGTTWEESIILCPDHIQLICLSATVTNAGEIAGWIGRTHRPIRLIVHNERPVPLALYYFHESELTKVIDHRGQRVADFGNIGGEARRRRGQQRQPAHRQRDMIEEPQPHEIVDVLKEQDLLPAIYFLFSRNDCQVFAERLAMMSPELTTPDRLQLIDAVLDTYLASMRPEDRELEQVRTVVNLARKGIGFHHAGLLPILKQLVEVLFGRGLMQVVFATDTLALGVNMPARTVVIGRMTKWDGRRRRALIPNEFQQMSGRAGRRGMDAFGHVVIPYSPVIPFREAMEIATGELHPVQSAFAIRYNTVLNLWDPPRGERVRQMLQRSLAQYQTSQRIRIIEHDIVEIEAELVGLTAGHTEEIARADELLEEYNSLNRSLQALERQDKDLALTISSLREEAETSTPWTEPGRLALRKLLRSTKPGLVVHARRLGWAVFLGRSASGGIGSFLSQADRQIHVLEEYRQIDHVDDDKRVELPEALVDPVDEAIAGINENGNEDIARVMDAIDALGLPDLDEIARTHRQIVREQAEAEIATLDTELREIREQIAHLVEQKNAHPFRDGKARKQHQRSLRQRDNLEKEKNTLADILAREIDAEDVRIRAIIRGIRDILHRFGYLQRGYPTEKADMLADVFDNDGLIICEMIDQGLLDALAPEEVAEVFSWFSFDREFRYTNGFTLPNRLVTTRRRLEDLEHEIIGEERDLKLFISEGHNPSFYGPALHWCRGWTMAQIGETIELSEGDLVITFNKTIDLMRQVRDMMIDVMPEHPLRYRLRDAEKLIRRGIVEQSLTLGFAPIDTGEDEQAADDPAEEDIDTFEDEAAAID